MPSAVDILGCANEAITLMGADIFFSLDDRIVEVREVARQRSLFVQQRHDLTRRSKRVYSARRESAGVVRIRIVALHTRSFPPCMERLLFAPDDVTITALFVEFKVE